MGGFKINVPNLLVVGLTTFAAVWVINRGLTKANLSNFKA